MSTKTNNYNLIKPGEDEFIDIKDINKNMDTIDAKMKDVENKVGAPMIATTAAEMTNKERPYVYVGSQSGYTKGNWYYWNGSSWVSGGVYNSVAVETDKTLTVEGKAADGEVVGQEIGSLKESIGTHRNKIGGLLLTDFSKGTIYQGKYLNNESLWNISTPKYISFPYQVTVYAKDGYKIKFIFKKSNGNYTDEFGNKCLDSGWLSSPTVISMNDSVRFCVRKDPLVESGEANIAELFSAIIISNRIDKIENDITDVYKSLYLTPEMFGAVGNNKVDDSDAFINAIMECLKSGKALFLNGKTYKINKQLNIPMNSDGKQKPLRIVGSGAYFDGQSLGLNGGTVLNMQYDVSGESGGKITTLGIGLLDISGVTFTDEVGTSTPFIYTTYTTLHIHECSFVGTKNGIKCNQDAIILGGTTENEKHEQSGVNNGFQGYGTIIRDNYFNHIRRAVYGRVFANGVIVQNNCIWNASGTNLTDGACIEFDECAENATQYNSGGLIIGNLIEVGSYYYPIKLGNCGFFSIIANNLYDAGAKDKVAIAGCWFTNKAHHNILIPGFSSRGYGTMGVYKDNGESNMIISTQSGCVMLSQRLWAESLTVETPDKTKRYKIMVDNDGNVISEKSDY